MIATSPTDEESDEAVREIATLSLHTLGIEAEWTSPDGRTKWITLSQDVTDMDLPDEAADVIVGQFPIAEGEIGQIRVFVDGAALSLEDTTQITYDGPPNLPSHTQSGWKLNPTDGVAVAIAPDALVGIRVLFDFDERLQHNNGIGYQLRPTAPYEVFQPNPPAGAPGVRLGQLTVLMASDANRSDADGVAARLGGSVAYEPLAGYTWRLRLPVDIDVRRGAELLVDEPLVQGVLPAIDYAPYYLPSDALRTDNYHDALADDAWRYLQDAGMDVGSRRVRVAVIDPDGVDIDHPDLYLNIGINQAEIPAHLKPPGAAWAPDTVGTCTSGCLVDVSEDGSPDGVITMRDLNNKANHGDLGGAECASSPHPVCDNDDNGLIGTDEVFGSGLADLIDNDNPTGTGSTVDDLFGVWFGGSATNRPIPGTSQPHGTMVAGLVGALPADAIDDPDTEDVDESAGVREEYRDGVGNDGSVGIAWKVSIVPLKASFPRVDEEDPLASVGMPDATYLDAITWIERVNRDGIAGNDIDIAVTSAGWVVYQQGAGGANCARVASGEDKQRVGADTSDFVGRVTEAQLAFEASDQGMLLRDTTALYVFAAGNENMNIGRADVLALPQELFTVVDDARDNVLVVGWGTGSRNDLEPAIDASYGDPDVVDLWAPGDEWFVLQGGGGYGVSSGSSTAAPVVAGTAALVKATHPTLTAEQIRDRILGPAILRENGVAKACLLTQWEANVPLLDVHGAVQ